MTEQAVQARAAAIEGFAATLRELRESVGTPSFRELAGRSRAISHTTLHEAAQGNRLPSWPTTVEFVKACGGDPAQYRARWEQANRIVLDAEHDHAPVTAPEGVAATPQRTAEQPIAEQPIAEQRTAEQPIAEQRTAEPPTATSRRRFGRRRVGIALLATTVVAAGAVVVAVVTSSGSSGSPGDDDGGGVPKNPTAADCPLHRSDPPPRPPRHAGDAAFYVGDITLQDCTTLKPNVTVTKVWRLKNAGSVYWRGYTLHRVDVSPVVAKCGTPGIVPVADTAPGHLVDLEVPVTTPDGPAYCFAVFKMYDATGHLAFPGARGINFNLLVS